MAAGSRVLAVCTSHERSELEGTGATWIVTDLSKCVPDSHHVLRPSPFYLSPSILSISYPCDTSSPFPALSTEVWLIIRVKTEVKDGVVHLEIDESP